MDSVEFEIVSSNGMSVNFKVRRTLLMGKVYEAYEGRQGIAGCVLLYKGTVIEHNHTPDSLNFPRQGKIVVNCMY